MKDMNHYSNKNGAKKDERLNIIQKRMGTLIHSLSELALMIDKNNSEAVRKLDEVYRETEEVNREIGVLIEDIHKFEINES
ncbi:MAG: hypothetical protein ACTHJ7_06750 [Candidatus Nitrosocosmicus sp.]